MPWASTTTVGGEISVTLALTVPVAMFATGDVVANVGGIKWPQSLVSVASDRLSITLAAPATPVGWEFAADEYIEAHYEDALTYTPGIVRRWGNTTASGGERSIAVVLAVPVSPDATGDVEVWVGGVKWPQASVAVSASRLVVTVSAPADPVDWTFSANETIEVRYSDGTPYGTASVSGDMSAFAALMETINVYAPTRAANATLGLNDPTYSTPVPFSALIEELDEQSQLSAFGMLVGRSAMLYALSAYRPTLDTDCLVKRASGDTYRVMGPPTVPHAGVIDHLECSLEWLPKPPTLT